MKLPSSIKMDKCILIEKMKNKASSVSLFYMILNTIIFIVIIQKTDAITERVENSLSTLHHGLQSIILQSLQIPSRSYKKEDILIVEDPSNKDNPNVENETREKELVCDFYILLLLLLRIFLKLE